jgi:metallophosphoesterase (TIGR00282 family)
MVVLFIGDVVADAGCAHMRKVLPGLKARYNVDITVANGENAAQGNGILPTTARFLFDSGVDIITTGNHALRRWEAAEALERGNGFLRPANFHSDAPGGGVFLFDNMRHRLCVVNLQGVVFMPPNYSPFDRIDEILKTVDTPCVLVDFHAEATAEKLCMGYYLDGRVSAVIGTHTHVPTADARILPRGTGYVTDAGMCGAYHSVLGVKTELAVRRMRTNLPVRFEPESHDCRLSGAVLTIDDKTGKCQGIEQILFV